MAPTLVHVDGFELQLQSNSAFAAGGTALCSITSSTVSTSVVKHGAASLQIPFLNGTTSRLTRAEPAGRRTYVCSFYVNLATLPGSSFLILGQCAGPSSAPTLVYDSASARFGMKWTLGATTYFGPGAVVAGRWYLIDWKFDVSGSTFTQTARCDGNLGTEATLTIAGTAGDITTMQLGTANTNQGTANVNFDDWIYGTTLADYPYGEHTVELLKPISDGTHSTTGTNVTNQAGTVIGGAFTTAYQLVDEVPPESTDYIKQIVVASGDYAEVVFATPTGTPWGATYWCAIEGEAANAADLLLRVVNSSGTTLLDQGGTGAVSGTTRRYSVGYLAGDPTGNKGRVGFASDVSPVPRALTFVAQAVRPTGVENVDGVGIPIR